MATIHVADPQGARVVGASVSVQQTAKDFPIGSAIASTILGNQAYQKWFVDRFNAAVFEDELKWYSTEPTLGLLRFDVPDQMLAFVRSHRVMVRGHNIFWENQDATPRWVKNLTSPDDLRAAVNARIQGLMTRYRGEFAHWDVNNEMLHYNFYEQRLGPNASMEFFSVAQDADPLATLFMNEYNVIETCDDPFSTVDTYAAKLRELRAGGAILEGIGLEGHFSRPNIPLMRAILDKLATLGLPIWFTERHQQQVRRADAGGVPGAGAAGGVRAPGGERGDAVDGDAPQRVLPDVPHGLGPQQPAHGGRRRPPAQRVADAAGRRADGRARRLQLQRLPRGVHPHGHLQQQDDAVHLLALAGG